MAEDTTSQPQRTASGWHRLPAAARDMLVLAVLGLAVNGAVALLISQPGYVDAAYYFNGGLAIVEGRGLVDPYIWNYVGAPDALPAPAFGYWQPLPSFMAALGIWLFGRGAAYGSAQAVFVAASSLIVLLSYTLARQLGERRHAVLAGLLTVFGGFYVLGWSTPESFTPFALAGTGALLLAGLGRRRRTWWPWLLAGLCCGAGHLTRADGLLLIGVVMAAALAPPRLTHDRAGGHVGMQAGWRVAHALVALAGYGLVMAPWFARNVAAFGSWQAPGGLSTMWLVEYNDMFSYPSDLTAARYLAAGAGTILRAKWDALLANLATFIGAHNLVFLTPLTLIGLGRRWRSDWLLAAVVYGLALFAAMTFVFSLPGMRGGWWHSGAALVPFVIAAAALGLDDVLRWAARRRSAWRFESAWPVFSAAAVALAVAVTLWLVLTRIVGLDDLSTVRYNQPTAVYAEIGRALDEMDVPPDARVVSNNPPGFYTRTGRGGIPLVNGTEQDLLRAADHYGATFLVADRNMPDGLAHLAEGSPATDRLELVAAFGIGSSRTLLYRIHP